MSSQPPSFEQLNAYVDNELPPREAAEVARAIARDAALADQVALLARLRSAVAESVEPPELRLPPPQPARERWQTRIAGACVAALLLLAAALSLVPLSDQRPAEDWLRAAWALHEAWIKDWPATVAADGGEETSPVVPVAELDGAYVPDLSATGLSVAQVVERPFVGNHSALVVGYTGTRGCRLTLVIARLGWPLEEAFTRHGEAGHVAYSWRAGSLGFILLAEAMDADRFELIAHSVYRASIEHLPFDDKTRMALMKNRRASKPCLT